MLIQTFDNAFAQKDFLAHLIESNEKTTAAIETKGGRFVVATLELDSSIQVVDEKDGGTSFVLIAEFALLIVVIGLIIFFILRKKRKNQIDEDEE